MAKKEEGKTIKNVILIVVSACLISILIFCVIEYGLSLDIKKNSEDSSNNKQDNSNIMTTLSDETEKEEEVADGQSQVSIEEPEGNQVTNTSSIDDKKQSKDEVDEKLLIYNENNDEYILWKNEKLFYKNKEIKLDLNNDEKLEYISVGLDSPNGEKVTIVSDNIGVNLLHYISDEMYSAIENLYDDIGELKEGNMIQVVFIDFDDDGKDEVVLAIGDGLVNLGVSIFKIDYDSKDLNFNELAFFRGQGEIHIDKNKSIEIPFGSKGLFEKYEYKNGIFIDMNEVDESKINNPTNVDIVIKTPKSRDFGVFFYTLNLNNTTSPSFII